MLEQSRRINSTFEGNLAELGKYFGNYLAVSESIFRAPSEKQAYMFSREHKTSEV